MLFFLLNTITMLSEARSESKSDTPENKCSILQKLYSPTIRLSISLREPDDESCSVYNYISLISEEKRNRRIEREKIGGKQNVDTNEEIDDEVTKLAAHFEEKYGNGPSKKKKKKKVTTFYNYSELASGYDESDSFIDNSEAFDEALPDEMQPYHGGYYVNIGQLEFKKVETVDENSEAEELRVSKKRASVLKSDDSNDDDSSKSESSSSDSETEDVANGNKKLPEVNDQKIVECESTKNALIPFQKNQDKSSTDKTDPNNTDVLTNGNLSHKKKKYKKRHISDETEVRPKKKARTVKILLEEKRVVENDEGVSGCVGKSVENYYNSINDVIESVVNAARNQSEDSRDSSSSCSETKSIDSRTSCDTEKENHTDEVETTEPVVHDGLISNITKELIKLPDNLPPDILTTISQLKSVALSTESGVRTFFNTPSNCKLLSKLDEKTRSLPSSYRLGVYTYLASFLPCSKDTLMKRAKKYLTEEEDKKIIELLNKLKSLIDKIMPALLDKYNAAFHHNSEEKSVNGASLNNQFEENSVLQRLPPKKFVWTDEIRNLVNELAMCHIRCLQLFKPKKESIDEQLIKFLETKVKPLWPPGWMDCTILVAEAHINSVSLTAKKTSRTSNAHLSAKKSQPAVPSSNSLNSTSVSVPSTAYNLLTNSLALQSLSMQYSPQPDSVYSAAAAAGFSAASIPYHSDLSLISSASPVSSTLPFPMDVLSRIAGTSAASQSYPIASTSTITNTTSANPYSKCVSPTKKQVASMSLAPSSLHRASTTVVGSVAGLPTTLSSTTCTPAESRKSTEPCASKLNDMFKIDSLISATTKVKKEHHQLNHVSQYNKHYSHKVEKKKAPVEKREDHYIPVKSPVGLVLSNSNAYGNNKSVALKSHSSNNNSHAHGSNQKNVGITSSKSGISGGGSGGKRKQNSSCNGVTSCSDIVKIDNADQVLDLSPSKIIKVDKKSDVMPLRMDHHSNYKNESNMKHAASANVTAKDHNYWSNMKEEIEIKEEKCDPIVCSSVPSLDNFKNQNETAKLVHISRKQRILQESIKSTNQDAAGPILKESRTKPPVNSSVVSNHVQHDISLNILPSKSLDDRKGRSSPAMREEKRSSLHEGKLSVDDKKIKSPIPGREEKRMLSNDSEVNETTTATDILSRIINDSLQEGNNPSRRSPFLNSTYDSLERKLDRDSRGKEQQKRYDTEIKLVPASLKESQSRLVEPTFVAASAERKQHGSSDRIGGQKMNDGSIRDLSVQPRIRLGGEHRPDKKSDRDARGKERSPNCDGEMKLHFAAKESQRHHSEKRSGPANNDQKLANSATDPNSGGRMVDDLLNDLRALNKFDGHSIPRRMEQFDPAAAHNIYKTNANEMNGSGSEALNQSSLSSSSKPRCFQDEFYKHILKMEPPGNS